MKLIPCLHCGAPADDGNNDTSDFIRRPVYECSVKCTYPPLEPYDKADERARALWNTRAVSADFKRLLEIGVEAVTSLDASIDSWERRALARKDDLPFAGICAATSVMLVCMRNKLVQELQGIAARSAPSGDTTKLETLKVRLQGFTF